MILFHSFFFLLSVTPVSDLQNKVSPGRGARHFAFVDRAFLIAQTNETVFTGRQAGT
jgi:hypothetical protein